MTFLWGQEMVKSSSEFENSCIPMHWQIQGWRENLRFPFGQS